MHKIVNHAIANLTMPGITIIRSKGEAISAVDLLYKHGDRVHAWDTETIGVNPKVESPVGKGRVICATSFIGPEVDFGNGPSRFLQ